MKAFVLRGGRGCFEERDIPAAAAREVVVRTTTASVCSADAACVNGEFPAVDGVVLGHEAVGVVHEIGAGVEGFVVGQRVTVASTTPCGVCTNCQRGFSGHCGGQAWGGYSYGLSRDGSLAEYFVVPSAAFNLVSIPGDVSDEAAVCVPDTIASGSTGPEAAGIPLGGAVAVFGQGHVGLGATMTARAMGAGLVIAVKATPGGDALAHAVGADVLLNMSDHDVVAEIRRLTFGQGADVAIEASGTVAAFPKAVAATRLGGTIAVLSSYAGDSSAQLTIPLEDWGNGIGDKTILSTFQQSGRERMQRLLQLVRFGRLDPSPLITERYSFEETDQALADLFHRKPGLVKPIITF